MGTSDQQPSLAACGECGMTVGHYESHRIADCEAIKQWGIDFNEMHHERDRYRLAYRVLAHLIRSEAPTVLCLRASAAMRAAGITAVEMLELDGVEND